MFSFTKRAVQSSHGLSAAVMQATTPTSRAYERQLAALRHRHPLVWSAITALDLCVFLAPLPLQYFDIVSCSSVGLKYGWTDNYTVERATTSLGEVGCLVLETFVTLAIAATMSPLKHRAVTAACKAVLRRDGAEVGKVVGQKGNELVKAARSTARKPSSHVIKPIPGSKSTLRVNVDHKPSGVYGRES